MVLLNAHSLGGGSVLATTEATENVQVEAVSHVRVRGKGSKLLLSRFVSVYMQRATSIHEMFLYVATDCHHF